MVKSTPQKNKLIVVAKKLTSSRPVVVRTSAAVKSAFKHAQSSVQKYTSRYATKRRRKSLLRQDIIDSLVITSKAVRNFVPYDDGRTIPTKKREEENLVKRWYRPASKMRKIVVAVTTEPYFQRFLRPFRNFRFNTKVVRGKKLLKTLTGYKLRRKPRYHYRKKRTLFFTKLGQPRPLTFNKLTTTSFINSGYFLDLGKPFTTIAIGRSGADSNKNFITFAERRAKWAKFLYYLKKTGSTLPLTSYIRKFRKLYRGPQQKRRAAKRAKFRKYYVKKFSKFAYKKQTKKLLIRLVKPSRRNSPKHSSAIKLPISRKFYLTKKLRAHKRFKQLEVSLKKAVSPSRISRTNQFVNRYKGLHSANSIFTVFARVHRSRSVLSKKNNRSRAKFNTKRGVFALKNVKTLQLESTNASLFPGTDVFVTAKAARMALMRLRLKDKRVRTQQLALTTLLKQDKFNHNAANAPEQLLPGKRNFNATSISGKHLLVHRYRRVVKQLFRKSKKRKTLSASLANFTYKKSTMPLLLSNLCLKVLPKQVAQTNRLYKRVYLRRRVRAASSLRRRARLRRFVPVRYPTTYEIGRPRPRYTKRTHWRRRRFLEKKRLTRLKFSRSLPRSSEKLLFIPKKNTAVYEFMRLRRENVCKVLKKLPRYSPIYKLKFRRWHSYRDVLGLPLPRIWPSRAEVRRLMYTNRSRRRRGLKPKKRPDPVYYELETTLGSTSAIGYRRRRRVLQNKFNTNRWWKPSALPNPVTTPVDALSYRYPHRLNFLSNLDASNLKNIVSFRKYAKRYGLRHVRGETAHLLRRQLGGYNNWRSVHSIMPTSGINSSMLWSLNKLNKIISLVASTDFVGIWERCASVLGPRASIQLRSYFVKQSSFWLDERYSERKFAAKLSELNSKLSPAVVKNLVILSRQKLFQKFPQWWVDETRRRLRALDRVLDNFTTSGEQTVTLEKVLILLSSFVASHATAHNMLVSENEKSLLTFMLSRLPMTDKEVLLKNFFRSTEECFTPTKKGASSSYQFWLRGIETHMKKLSLSRSSLDHNESRKKVITLLGNDRARFPGIGRRLNSYDRALRLFYRKTVPSRFRRVQNLRFRWLKPSMIRSFYERKPALESFSEDRQSRRLLQPLVRLPFLTRAWRRVLNRRNTRRTTSISRASSTLPYKQKRSLVTKRRFQKLPLELTLDNILGQTSNALPNGSVSLDALTEPLLLSAIKDRLKAQRLQDLTLHVNRRLLPTEQILPPRMAASKARKRRKARGSLDYFLPTFYEPRTETRWALSDFMLNVSKKRPSRNFTYTASGELICDPFSIVRKPGMSKGFVLNRSSRKVRRFRKRRRYRGRFLKIKRKFRSRRLLRRTKRYKKRSIFSFRSLKQVVAKRLLTREHGISRGFTKYVTGRIAKRFVLPPLQFTKPALEASISEKEKARQKAGLEVLKQGHYKRAAQLTTSITKLFPQLISLLIDRHALAEKSLNYKELRGVVRSVYWSLRFYLQHDFEGHRLAARDLSRRQFNLLRTQTSRDAEELYFEAQEFKAMRQRFQPYRMHTVRLSRRTSVDWLRMFFPRWHSLYLEDPEEYRDFFVTPTQAMRANPSRKAPGQWFSHNIAGSMENKFRRLTNSSSLENSSRFENILMTSRRAPVIAGRGAAASVRSGSLLSSPLVSNPSFFRRSYSTTFFRTFSSVPIVTDRVLKTQRHVVNPTASLSDCKALAVRQSLKSRIYAKSQTSHVETNNDIGVGSLDPRFVRMKSPRNRQFLRRLNQDSFNSVSTLNTAHMKNVLPVMLTAQHSGLHAAVRNSIRPAAHDLLNADSLSALNVSRGENPLRRLKSFLNTRALSKVQILPQRRLIFSRRKFARKFAKRQCLHELKASTAFGFDKTKKIVSNSRSILQFRKASHRLADLYFTKSPVVAREAIILRPNVARFLRSYSLHTSVARRILKWRSKISQGWFRKKSFALHALNLPKRRQAVRLKSNCTLGKLHFGAGVNLRHNTKFRLKYFSKGCKPTEKPLKLKPKSVFFGSQARLLYSNAKRVAKFLAVEQNRGLLNLESTRRQEVWGEITLRWMKKHRVLKNWLKNTKRGLKRNNWKQMPELLFKGMRVRLRKLEWREPDKHFNRRGWRNAFSFYPNERKKAPWLERLMFRRSLYSTLRGPYRRYQFPREQKRLNWLQQYRKAIFARGSKKYIKGRRWPKLRIYNQRLHRGLFSIRNTRVAQRHFKKLGRRKPKGSGFAKSLLGLADRLDVNLVLLNIAPTIFWAKVLAAFGVFSVNNKTVCDPNFRFKQNDRIYWNWTLIERLREHFQRPLRHYDQLRIKNTFVNFPKNFEYFPTIRTAIYKGLPRPEDLQKNGRLTPFLFKMFRADSGFGR